MDNTTNNTEKKNVFELAITLGKALKEDERLVRMDAARQAYEQDPALKQLMTEYDVQQKAIQEVASADAPDTQLIESIQNRINQLYDEIMTAPVYKELLAAQEAVNELMNAVNNTITFAITGEMPSSCTHDCSTCGGCH